VSEVAVQIAALLIERDRTERSRRESEQRLTLAVHGARLATWEWDLARDQVTVSHPFESASGFPLAAFQGSCEAFIQTVLPVDRDGVALALARARRERDDFDVSFRVKASHDEVRWIAIKGVVSRDAARLPIRLVGLAMDMNAWKVVESPEESPYAQFRTITDVSADGVIILQDGVHIAYINAAALNLLGAAQPEDVLQKPLLAIVHPDAHGAIREQVQRLLNQGQPIALPDARYVRLDGSSFHAEMAGFLLGSHNGQALCLVLHDRTQRKRLDMQLRQAAKMETVARLAAGIAHDFNNLLTIILGCSNELLTRFAPQDRVYVYAQDISRAAEQASTLTNQLLAFSRQQVARHQAVDLNELVTRLGTTLRSLLGEQRQLITILDPALRLTKADPAQLERILINLIMNARDAMPNGGTVYVQTGNGEFEAQEINDAGMGQPRPAVCLEVHDTGHGMDEDTQAHLFEPFFTTKGLGYGRGLGLASVYGTVMQHGGTIVAHSVPDHGSTFRIALPAHETSTDYASPASAQRSGVAGSETILLVEDDAGVRGFLQRLLASRGYHVLEAGDGPAALQHCTSTSDPVHLLLTDVMMPGMTGPQLADKVKGISPATRVIYMSGYTDETVASGWRDSLPAAFLHKPFLPDVLLETVRRVLDQPE
jgi:PAS domain S-box-containing protein